MLIQGGLHERGVSPQPSPTSPWSPSLPGIAHYPLGHLPFASGSLGPTSRDRVLCWGRNRRELVGKKDRGSLAWNLSLGWL